MRNILKEVCEVIIKALQPEYLRQATEEEWRYIAASFLELWNMPNCVGALDGKHIIIQAPPNSGSQFYNYKRSFSEVLFAACDTNYIFTLVHVGEMGSNSDAAIFADSLMGQQLQAGQLNLPKGTAKLPGSNIYTPCFFVGDDAFPLSRNLVKPYSGNYLSEDKKIFNYRLSRARRVIENAFCILATRFRIFRKPIALLSSSIDIVILAAVCLHNFLKIRDDQLAPSDRIYCPRNYVDTKNHHGIRRDGNWRDIPPIFNNGNVHQDCTEQISEDALAIRNTLTKYFLTPEGQVPWQFDYIRFSGNLEDL